MNCSHPFGDIAMRRINRKNGLCDCGTPVEKPGGKRCRSCRETYNLHMAVTRRKRLNQSPRDNTPYPAERIISLRSALGESVDQFAKRIGAHRTSVYEWQRGRDVPSRKYREIMDKLREELGLP